MSGSRDEHANANFNVRPGAENIIHEIGHAMEFGRSRLAIEKDRDAKKEYNTIKKQLVAAKTTTEKVSLGKKLNAAKKVKDDAKIAMNKALDKTPLDEFIKLTKGKISLTEYSKRSAIEAFAEAYMLYKVAPETLEKKNKKLFKWFNKGGFL